MIRDQYSNLVKDFPRIFNTANSGPTPFALFSFEVSDGWYTPIRSACSLIQGHIDQTRKERARALWYNRILKRGLAGDTRGLAKWFSYDGCTPDYTQEQVARALSNATPMPVGEACPQVVASQVKEKFGGLRFYYNGGDDTVDGIIRMAEAWTGQTCETCGNPGTLGGNGWLTTLCKKCRNARNKARKEAEAKYE